MLLQMRNIMTELSPDIVSPKRTRRHGDLIKKAIRRLRRFADCIADSRSYSDITASAGDLAFALAGLRLARVPVLSEFAIHRDSDDFFIVTWRIRIGGDPEHDSAGDPIIEVCVPGVSPLTNRREEFDRV